MLSGQQETSNHARCRSRLLQLPAEVRELIWIHAVTSFAATESKGANKARYLEKQSIRIDKFNQPLPPPITSICTQVRLETLPLYYTENTFELWQPLYWLESWYVMVKWTSSSPPIVLGFPRPRNQDHTDNHLFREDSALVDWLTAIGPDRISWLRDVVLLYKHEEESEFDIESALAQEGFNLRGVTRRKLALTEYEVRCESLGLPRQFGSRGRRGWR